MANAKEEREALSVIPRDQVALRAETLKRELGPAFFGEEAHSVEFTAMRPQLSCPVVVVDKSTLFRDGLSHILPRDAFRVAASVSSLSALPATAIAEGTTVALVSLDPETPDLLAQLSALIDRSKGLRVIVLSEQLNPQELFAAIEAGADGYLLKNEISSDALLKSLEFVVLGGVVLPREFTKIMRNGPEADALRVPFKSHPVSLDGSPQEPLPSVLEQAEEQLSKREQGILKLLTQGATNKHIARDLNIAESTVKVHVKNLMRKLGVDNRTKAAMWAVEARQKGAC